MTAADVPACAAVVVAEPFFVEYGLTQAGCEASLDAGLRAPGHELRVAETAGRIDGFAWFAPEGAFMRAGYLRLLAVAPGRQSRGVGRLLMSAIEAAHLHQRDVLLLVSAHNMKARGFYGHLGYVACGALPDFVRAGFTELIYRKVRVPTDP